MMRLMITAPSSNSGKTAVTCGLLSALKKRGMDIASFKCGPDYIDPMFHRSVLGVDSHNLDVFLAGEEGTSGIFKKYSKDKDAVIVEGVMGYYDGLGKTAEASAWHISSMLDIPSVLVIRPAGSALSLAAVIKGIAEFRRPSNIEGVILNDCSKAYFDNYGSQLESESGIPILGYLPHMKEAVIESRHLGLMTAGEIKDIRERIDRIGETMEESVHIDRLISIGTKNDKASVITCSDNGAGRESKKNDGFCDNASIRIGVARDEAFCFIYDESLDAIREAGGESVFFSPLHDRQLPDDIGGMYLPGGYPELYAEEIDSNRSMAEAVKNAQKAGMPMVAECGGFLYLGSDLKDINGKSWKMTRTLPGTSENKGRLVRFGYGHIEADGDSLLFRKGERIPVHEFHHWDTTEPGDDMQLVKSSNGSRWKFGYSTTTLYAGFPHLYMSGELPLAERFVKAAGEYLDRRRQTGL